MRVEEEMLKKVIGESVEETLRGASDEGVAARARKVRRGGNRGEERLGPAPGVERTGE